MLVDIKKNPRVKKVIHKGISLMGFIYKPFFGFELNVAEIRK
jgi:hypothetical protein